MAAPTVAVPWGTQPQAPVATTEGTAVVALVCSILSWIALPVVLAIVALVLAGSAEREIAASAGTKSGQGLVSASRWIAWINLLVAAMVVAFVAAFALAVAIAR
jgi:preprotein translocase subunit SecG